MIDGYGRTIDYVRISVTDRCNLRCVYCMPEEGVGSISHEEILRFGEIERVCQILAENGIQKIKLTGGEPLVRRRLPELAAALKRIPGIKSLTITTNGVLLEEMYDALADAGVDSVTISLDTLDASVYRQLTRRDEIEAVRRGLRTAIQKGRMQIKINCVPVLGIEEQKLLEVAELAKNHNVHVRFIEMMPIGMGTQFAFVKEEHVVVLDLPDNASHSEVATMLKDEGVIQCKWAFKLYAALSTDSDTFKSGKFEVSSDMDYGQIINTLNRVATYTEMVDVTIPEGYTIQQIAEL